MRDKPTRAQLAVGLIGLGSSWEQHYRDAVRSLSAKLCVRAVCDAVHVRAAAVAEEFRAATFSSPWRLAQRPDIKAWLILDPGCFGTYPVELATRINQPTLFANCFDAESQRAAQLFRDSIERGESLMAEFPQRFLPATTRLRELIATKLGPVRRVTIQIPRPSSGEVEVGAWLVDSPAESVGIFDWCSCIIGQSVASVHVESHQNGHRCSLVFATQSHNEFAPVPAADIVLIKAMQRESDQPLRTIECERGSATIAYPASIAWQTETEHADESLTHERSPYEIILDQFCRRALGGLVPVPTLADAVRGLTIRLAAIESLAMKMPVSVKLPSTV